MIKLLQYIIMYLTVLFDKYGFLIKESQNSGNRFSGASILLESSEVEMFLAIERDEITMHFHSLFDKRKNNWYSSDVILALLGHKEHIGVLNERSSILIRSELPEILRRFSNSEIFATLQLLDEIEKDRSKRL